jgi:hypothetical protein
MITKEFRFIATVRIADDIALKYPNYWINGFTHKSLAKRLISGNSEKNSMEDFGYKYETVQTRKVKKLFVVQEIGAVEDKVKNIAIFQDKQTADGFLFSHQVLSETVRLVVNELDISAMELYRG